MRAALIAVLLASLMSLLWQPAGAEVRIATVPLGGPRNLGVATMTILNLKIWKTLLGRNVRGQKVAKAQLLWDLKPLAKPTHESAVERARRANITSLIVVWGELYQVGEDAVVTSFVTLPPYNFFRRDEELFERWRLDVGSTKSTRLEVDVPGRAYAFKPFSLKKAFLSKYDVPDALPVYKEASQKSAVIGQLGTWFRSLGGSKDFVQVRFKEGKGGVGWVFLPELADNSIELVDFVSGLIRVYRGDWQHAVDAFSVVARNDRLPVAIQIDALLHMVHAKSMLGLDADSEISAAKALDPYSATVTKFELMRILSTCNTAGSRGSIQRIETCSLDVVEKAQHALDAKSYLFEADDPWLVATRQAITILSTTKH